MSDNPYTDDPYRPVPGEGERGRGRWSLYQLGRALSRLLNWMTGGEGDTSFSARSWELLRQGRLIGFLRVWFADWINGEVGHCYRAWLWHEDHGLFVEDESD